MTTPIRSAATVVLLRDAPGGVETFLMRRHGAAGFMAGATVFPGGKLDDADAAARTSGLDPAACAARLQVADPELAWRIHVAAIRELQEEAHVLLARTADGALAGADVVSAIEARLAGAHEGHQLPASLWHEAVAASGLTLALDLLTPFAHWLTPRAEPRRFDTWFFAAVQPHGQHAALDPHESTDAFWRTGAAALADHEAGGAILLPPPTLHTMLRLIDAPGAAQEVAAALAAGGVGPCIEPHFDAVSADGPAILLPEDIDHPEHASWRAQTGQWLSRSRFVLRDGRFSLTRAAPVRSASPG